LPQTITFGQGVIVTATISTAVQFLDFELFNSNTYRTAADIKHTNSRDVNRILQELIAKVI
jgi:hypothetical protein